MAHSDGPYVCPHCMRLSAKRAQDAEALWWECDNCGKTTSADMLALAMMNALWHIVASTKGGAGDG